MSKVKKVDNNALKVEAGHTVQVTKAGNTTEVKTSLYQARQTIKKLNKNEYVLLKTGEIKEFLHYDNRSENLKSLRKSMQDLRNIINTNCTDNSKCKFITLTYKENMTDAKRLYEDVKKFHMRLRYFLKGTKFEYITVIEPQGRGAWHIHEIVIFDEKAPFIPNAKLAEIWGHGFTKINNIDNVNNVGSYLTAYLCDIPLEQASFQEIRAAKNIKEIQTIDENGNKVIKKVIKGARLKYYPTGMHFYRCSRAIKRPQVIYLPNYEAEKMVKNHILTYENTIQITNSKNDLINVINYKYYNKLPKQE